MNRKIVSFVVCFLFFSACFYAVGTPKMTRGVLDLRDWDFAENGLVSVEGEWLIDFGNAIGGPSASLPLYCSPGTWSQQKAPAESFPPFGECTLYATLLLPENGSWGFRFPGANGAYSVLINGKQALSRGKLRDPETGLESINRGTGYVYGQNASVLNVAIRFSNYYDGAGGGLISSPEIGLNEQIDYKRTSVNIVEAVMAGILLIIAIYHLILYAIRKSEKSILVFSLLCLVLCLRQLFTNERFILNLVPALNPYSVKLEIFSVWAAGLALINYSHGLFSAGKKERVILRLLDAFGIAGIAALAAIPDRHLFFSLNFLHFYIIVSGLYAIAVLVAAIARRESEAMLVCIGTASLLLPALFDIVVDIYKVNGNFFSPFGMIPFIVIHSYLLAVRYTRGAKQAEALLITNENLESLVQERTKDLVRSRDEAERRLRITEVYTRHSIVEAIEQGTDPTQYQPEARKMSILFSDIRNFTGMSENSSPIETVEFLNTYFDVMNQCVLSNHGEIDKLIGDCLMALYTNADDSVRSAIEMRRFLRAFNDGRDLKIRVDNGIGINYGEIILGNIGSSCKMDYTVIGDIVNIASRIESLTKYYKLPVLISQDIKNSLTGKYSVRFIDKVLVKGRTTPIRLYEVFDYESADIQRIKIDNTDDYERAFAHYADGDFKRAVAEYERLRERLGGHNYQQGTCKDPVVDFYIDRCRHLCEQQSAGLLGEWNGVFKFSDK